MSEAKNMERSISLRHWEKPTTNVGLIKNNVVVDCGWGRLIFAQTFQDMEDLIDTLAEEAPGKRDIAFYVPDPQVVVSLAPQQVFLDPSITYRLWLDKIGFKPNFPSIEVREVVSSKEAEMLRDCYIAHNMIHPDPDYILSADSPAVQYLVAVDRQEGKVVGGVCGVDHKTAFNDPENGASLWSLVVDSQCPIPGVGEALVQFLAYGFKEKGRSYLDLSVLHDNEQAIALYEKLGFERVPVFAIKNKNPINESLFIGDAPEENLNPYAVIIVKEAQRRGIAVEILDPKLGYFELSFGGRKIVCRESLTELTSAIAFSRCDDKRITRQVLKRAGLCVPAQCELENERQAIRFLKKYNRVVVKPARGEQGKGISVDIQDPESLLLAIKNAEKVCSDVLLEEFIEGIDLRIIVINQEVVAAAVRRPPVIHGTGQHTVKQLIMKLSRRREAATGGESSIPIDAETERCVKDSGYTMESILPIGESIIVRKTANLHTGGTIHDVTDRLSPKLVEVAISAAQALDIPVVGLDLLVESIEGDKYYIIEANERPGLANHEPQPTAERFIDLLFPQTKGKQNNI